MSDDIDYAELARLSRRSGWADARAGLPLRPPRVWVDDARTRVDWTATDLAAVSYAGGYVAGRRSM